MLRCSFVPLKDKAQHDRAVTPPDTRIILLIYIIGPLRLLPFPDYVVNDHHRPSLLFHSPNNKKLKSLMPGMPSGSFAARYLLKQLELVIMLAITKLDNMHHLSDTN
jgi:hypothetical protein